MGLEKQTQEIGLKVRGFAPLRPWRSISPSHVSGHASSVLQGLACQPALRWQSPAQLEMAVAIFSPFSSPLAYSLSLACSQSTLLPFLTTLLSTA
jgi:hypothetical protein